MASSDTSSQQDGTGTLTGSLLSCTNIETILENETWVSTLLQSGNKPEEWLSYLQHVEANCTIMSTRERLLLLDQAYRKARENIQIETKKDNEACATIFIKAAMIKKQLNIPEKARFLLRFVRANMKFIPMVHLAGAQFELDQGDKTKSLYILEKGYQLCGDEKLLKAIDRIKAGVLLLIEPEPETQSAHSNAFNHISSSAFEKIDSKNNTRTSQKRSLPPDGIIKPVPVLATPQCKVPPGIEHIDTIVSFRRPGPSSRNRNTSGNSDESDTLPLSVSAAGSCMSASKVLDKRGITRKAFMPASLNKIRPASTNKLPQRVLCRAIPMSMGSRDEEDDDEDDDDEDEKNQKENNSQMDLKPLNKSPPEERAMADHVEYHPHRLDPITEDRDSGVSINTPPTEEERVKPLHPQQFDANIPSMQKKGVPCSGQMPPTSTPMQHCSSTKAATGTPQTNTPPLDYGKVGKPPPAPHRHSANQHSSFKSRSSEKETIIVNDKCYEKLAILGKGGSSEVYKVIDPVKKTVLAVKYVSLTRADYQTIESYKNEITLLQRLHNKDPIIKLYDHEITSSHIYIVMECGSSDLATFLKKKKVETIFIPFYWAQMLQAVQCIHDEGIIHRDLKPANFLFVDGSLKLIDFGIANAIQMDADCTSIIKDSQMGTLNYMSPEAIQDTSPTQGKERGKLQIKINRKSDVWSLGCILYYMIYRRTPFQHITNVLMKLQAICNDDYEIEFPETEDSLLRDIVKSCLIRDVGLRPSIQELLTTIRKRLATSNNEEPCTPPPQQTNTTSNVKNLMSQLSTTQVNSPRSMELAMALRKYLEEKSGGSQGSHQQSYPISRPPLHERNSPSGGMKRQAPPLKEEHPSRNLLQSHAYKENKNLHRQISY